jgi:hypothetical protein
MCCNNSSRKSFRACEKDCNSGQPHSRKEISGEFVIVCGDSAELLGLIKEALDEVALANIWALTPNHLARNLTHECAF